MTSSPGDNIRALSIPKERDITSSCSSFKELGKQSGGEFKSSCGPHPSTRDFGIGRCCPDPDWTGGKEEEGSLVPLDFFLSDRVSALRDI